MRILVVADGRSPITRNWVGDLIETGHDVVLASSFLHEPIEGIQADYSLPICFSRLAGSQTQENSSTKSSTKPSKFRKIIGKYRGVFQQLRYWLGPLTFWHYRRKLKAILSHYDFDLVHVLRIPFEGLFAVPVLTGKKVVVSIWGNDLTLHAPKSAYMRRSTRKVLEQIDGLIVDVNRDIELAREWGYAKDKPVMVALTSGGIDVEKMNRMIAGFEPKKFSLPEGKLVINPRGIRPGYIRNDTFFAAIPKVVKSLEEPVHFLCPSMKGQPEAENWVKKYAIEDVVTLLPYLSQKELWYCFSRAQVMVSPSTHDGTPNSLLESMVMGAVPVVGNIESLREWVVDEENGSLIDPSSVDELAAAIVFQLQNDELREQERVFNQNLVVEKASRLGVRKQREEFYNQILNQPID